MTPKQTLILELNRHTGGNGAFVYELIEAAVGMALAQFKEDRISKTAAEKLYGASTIRELENSIYAEDLFYRNSGAKNSKKFYSRQAIEAAISKMGWPMINDPLRRKRARYKRKKKEKKNELVQKIPM